jgi:ABC-type transport system involved in multi-copper enzyme maturation permease subunit
MTFLPIVERELRVASRRRGTYRVRFLAGLAGLLMAAWIVLVAQAPSKELGLGLFTTEAALLFFYTAIVGTLVTSDCLSEEKRDGTLGLLFLTDLKGRDVVLGKLAASSVNAIYGMLAVVPILALPILLGGVTRGEVFRVVLVALNLLFFFLSIGLAASALCRKDSRAYLFSIIVAVALVGLWPLATQLKSPPSQNPRAAFLSSPAYDCFLAFDSLYNGAGAYLSPSPVRPMQTDFWLNAAITLLYSWFFFGLACWAATRSWQDASFRSSGRFAWLWKSQSRAARGAMLDANPYLWRVARNGGKLVWLALLPVVLLWWWCDRLFMVDLFDPSKDVSMLALAGIVLKIGLTAKASRIFADDRRAGGLELLLTTPLGAGGIVRGQRLALWRLFAWPIVTTLLVNLAMLAIELPNLARDDRRSFAITHLLLAAFLVLDSWALSSAGMWRGLIARKLSRAIFPALLQILVLPFILFFAGIALFVLSGAAQRLNSDDTLMTVVIFGCLLCLGADLYFELRANNNLSENFQAVVAEGWTRTPRGE